MKRRITLSALSLLLLLTAACGGGGYSGGTDSSSSSSSAQMSAPEANYGGAAWDYPMEEPSWDYGEDWDYKASETAAEHEAPNSVYRNENAKLIREASLDIQTTEFDQAAANLEALVGSVGGYFQEANVSGGSYRDVNARRSGNYVVRIPAERYDTFLRQTGDLGYVTSKVETTEDIGEQYFDTQARLQAKQIKRERLLALLEQAENMEDIIALESALSDVEYEIELFSSTLRQYDSLVGFSTIRLYLQEVQRVTEDPGVSSTLGQRVSAALREGLEDFSEGLEDLLLWFSYNIFSLIFFALFVCLCVFLARRILRGGKRRREKKREKAQAAQTPGGEPPKSES